MNRRVIVVRRRGMSFAGLLLFIIAGSAVLDHLWITAGLVLCGLLFAACYYVGLAKGKR